MNFPIAIQLFSLRDDAGADLYATLKKLRAMGYDGVELAGFFDHTPEQVRDMCKELGLTPISAHVPYDDLLAYTPKTVSDYATVGCQYSAIPFLMPEQRPDSQSFGEVVENIKRFGRAVKEKGMQLLYHNHNFEFEKVGNQYALDILYDAVPADLLQTELDVCWIKAAGLDPVEYLLKYAGRSPLLHLKDFYGKESPALYQKTVLEKTSPMFYEEYAYRAVGSGLQDIPAILRAAKQAGVKWLVVEQDSPTPEMTPMECAAASCSYIKATLQSL